MRPMARSATPASSARRRTASSCAGATRAQHPRRRLAEERSDTGHAGHHGTHTAGDGGLGHASAETAVGYVVHAGDQVVGHQGSARRRRRAQMGHRVERRRATRRARPAPTPTGSRPASAVGSGPITTSSAAVAQRHARRAALELVDHAEHADDRRGIDVGARGSRCRG